MIKGLTFTDRDFDLLHDLYENVALSFEQIHKRHFAGRDRSTATNRISKLQTGGVLKARDCFASNDLASLTQIKVYQLTRTGIGILETKYPHKKFINGPMGISNFAVTHDLLVTEIATVLKQKHPEATIINGRLFDIEPKMGSRIPDIVIVTNGGKHVTAVEVELTLKSAKRYRTIIQQYRTDPRFHRVLYIVSKASIEEKIRSFITGQRVANANFKLPTNKFEFVKLRDLLPRTTNPITDNGGFHDAASH